MLIDMSDDEIEALIASMSDEEAERFFAEDEVKWERLQAKCDLIEFYTGIPVILA